MTCMYKEHAFFEIKIVQEQLLQLKMMLFSGEN